jgi:hypothetical protein
MSGVGTLPLASLSCFLCSSLLFGCVTDHDLFAASDGSGGRPNVVVIVSGAGGARGATGGASGSDGGSGMGGRPKPTEPSGPVAVSFLNGVTDAPSVSFCFAKMESGVESAPRGRPFPAETLSYGKTITVASVPGVNFSADALRPYVIAASPDAISGLDCSSIMVIARVPEPPRLPPRTLDGSLDGHVSDATASDAPNDGDAARDGVVGPVPVPPEDTDPRVPTIRAFPLPVIPAGTFVAERHYLFGLAGCMGGPGIRDPSEKSVCGESFSSTNPTLTPVFVTLSRIVTKDHVALQFVNASSAVRAADVRLAAKSLNPLSLAKNVVRGAIRPIPPNASRSAGQYGSTNEDRIQLFADGSTKPIYDEAWSKTLDSGGIPSLADGHAYTLLLIGPYPGFSKREWWNDPTVTIIAND